MSISRYIEQNFHSTEGMRGVENLALLCRDLGYKDPSYYGQFHQRNSNRSGCLGDIFEFLQDNPGAIEAICNWIGEQNIPEWNELGEEEEENED